MSISAFVVGVVGVWIILALNYFDSRMRMSHGNKPKDLWEGSDGFPVQQFRFQLEHIANELSNQGSRFVVYCRFNVAMNCAELYTDEGVLARIFARGEISDMPNEAVVYSNLTSSELELFSILEKRRNLVIEFLPLV